MSNGRSSAEAFSVGIGRPRGRHEQARRRSGWMCSDNSLDDICIGVHNQRVAWEVEFTDEFAAWWEGLSVGEQDSIDSSVRMLEEAGPALTRPYADTVRGSQYPNMRELRIQHQGRPYRVLYAFDPRRTGVLLIGGDKTGNPRWYREFVPKADVIYAQHLREIGDE